MKWENVVEDLTNNIPVHFDSNLSISFKGDEKRMWNINKQQIQSHVDFVCLPFFSSNIIFVIFNCKKTI